jgi:D-tyrosyl-tRNA(Tyr) deacylase
MHQEQTSTKHLRLFAEHFSIRYACELIYVRAVIQRVVEARVAVGHEVVGEIGPGLCILLGVGKYDGDDHAKSLADKVRNLRIFEDDQGKMNRSITGINGELLVISQFTIYGDCRRGNRPSFSDAAPAAQAERLYRLFIQSLRDSGVKVATGRFQAPMKVSLVNDGPVTLILEI